MSLLFSEKKLFTLLDAITNCSSRISNQLENITFSLCSTATKLVNFDTTENSLLKEMT